MQGQDITYVTERCVLRLEQDGLVVTEVAPGLDLRRDVLDQAATPLRVAPNLREMDGRLFQPELMGMAL
jgi:acyl CoA:acetate/3-ketoacid CoA transferase